MIQEFHILHPLFVIQKNKSESSLITKERCKMKWFKRRRWGDNDRFFGPITYSKNDKYYNSIAFILGSGDGDDREGCYIRISLFNYTCICSLPPIIKPEKKQIVFYNTLNSKEFVDKRNPNWYWEINERKYGFSIFEEHVSIYHGTQTNSSDTEKRYGFHIPWMQWRFHRLSYYD